MAANQSAKTERDLSQEFESMRMSGDNLASSRDSINAIPPSDIENIETDVEEQINRVSVPFAESFCYSENITVPKRNTELVPSVLTAGACAILATAAAAPFMSSQASFVSGNSNLILNHLNDNFAPQPNSEPANSGNTMLASVKKTRSKNLEKRKLSQNMDNFSVRMGHTIDADVQRRATEALAQNLEPMKEQKAHQSQAQLKDSSPSMDDNTPPCLLPGWDSCDETQSPPIENDEWLAFLHRSMQEVLDGELDSLKQHNLVSIIVAPLRNTKAIPKVVDSVAQLLALPFVLCEPSCVVDFIKNVYVDVKLVPNLMYASKLLMCQRSPNDSFSGSYTQRSMRPVCELNTEEIKATSHLYELVCHLVHLKHQFLSQFCDAMAILAADELFISFLNQDFRNSHALRICNCIVALFCCVLRDLPENAELVERIIFNAKLQLLPLLKNKDLLLRTRMCMLMRLLVRFSLRRVQAVWNTEIKQAMEYLAEDEHVEVRQEAECTLEELRQFAFFATV